MGAAISELPLNPIKAELCRETAKSSQVVFDWRVLLPREESQLAKQMGRYWL
jgi:hypothetical protein